MSEYVGAVISGERILLPLLTNEQEGHGGNEVSRL